MQKIIPGLVGLNVVLAGCLAVTLVLQTSRKKNAGSTATSPSQTYTGVTEGSQASLPLNNPSLARKGTWSALASPDLRKYAANLRRVGCPEDTIQEIMVAEVNRLYSARERGLKGRPDHVAPWG